MTATPAPTRCGRCGRTLTAAASIARGYGRGCAAKIDAATKVVDLADYQAAQLAKAAELIELVAIARTAPALYLAVSSRGDATYAVDQAACTCTCPAGERGVRCYHLAAATILAAA